MSASKLLSSVLNTSELGKSNEPILSPTLPPSPIQTASNNIIHLQMIPPEEEVETDDGLPRSIPTTPTFVSQQVQQSGLKEEIKPLNITKPSYANQEKKLSRAATEPVIRSVEKKRSIVELVQADSDREIKVGQASQALKLSTPLFPLKEEMELSSPIRNIMNTDIYDQPYPDFKMRRTFKKPSFYYRLKEKSKLVFAKLLLGKSKLRKSNRSRRMTSVERIFSETKEPTTDYDRYLSRSISAVAIVGKDSNIEEDESDNDEDDEDEQERLNMQQKQREAEKQLEGPPIFRRNVATFTSYNLSKTEPIASNYTSPSIDSGAAYDIKRLCEQSFFGSS